MQFESLHLQTANQANFKKLFKSLCLQYLFASFDDGKQIQYRYAATQALLCC